MILSLPPELRPLLETFAHEAQSAGIGLYVVGGLVRDLLLGKPNTDLDFVIEGDALIFVQRLRDHFGGGDLTHHPAFGTVTWTPVPGTFGVRFMDFATARTETYASPGALPTVRPSTLADDLRRRDFSINAMALRLSPAPLGELIDPFGGQRDLERQILCVLHARSFIDDPTRMLRGLRFIHRFGMVFDDATDALIPEALPFLDSVSGDRLRHEFELGWNEAEPEAVLAGLDAKGILDRVGLRFEAWQVGAMSAARGFRAQTLWGDF
ncbi:MAG TPA: hypothetical protein VMT34_14830, partial [Aggregatilineales bacterium]|nr:hypothetical protein [Aggregatilineales bacterium]